MEVVSLTLASSDGLLTTLLFEIQALIFQLNVLSPLFFKLGIGGAKNVKGLHFITSLCQHKQISILHI